LPNPCRFLHLLRPTRVQWAPPLSSLSLQVLSPSPSPPSCAATCSRSWPPLRRLLVLPLCRSAARAAAPLPCDLQLRLPVVKLCPPLPLVATPHATPLCTLSFARVKGEALGRGGVDRGPLRASRERCCCVAVSTTIHHVKVRQRRALGGGVDAY
jgi:hypothetical protein